MTTRPICIIAASFLFFSLLAVRTTYGGDLSKFVGYTALGSSTVRETSESRLGEKYIKLSNGNVFRVFGILLLPLPMTEVAIFVREPTQEMIDKYGDSLPKEQLYLYKLLIDNEAYDAVVSSE